MTSASLCIHSPDTQRSERREELISILFEWEAPISSITGGTNQAPAYYQECVSLFGKKVFMKPVNE